MMRRGIALLVVVAATVSGVAAQSGPPPAATGGPNGWSLDTSRLASPRHKGSARQRAPAVSAEEAERAARLAEARRKFFEKPDEGKPETIPEFGGYDSSKAGDGTFRPGATFKF